MGKLRTGLFVAALLASLGCLTADAQPAPTKFRGAYVCGTSPNIRGILRTSLDLIVDGGSAWFARPLFNQNGTLVVGSELAFGTIDADGQLRLTSQWSYLGDAAAGDYRGTIAAAGGTLIGSKPGRVLVRRRSRAIACWQSCRRRTAPPSTWNNKQKETPMRRGIFVATLLAAMPSCLVHAQSQSQNQPPELLQGEMQKELQDQLQNAGPDQTQGQMQDQVRDQLQNATPDRAQNQTQAGGQSQSLRLPIAERWFARGRLARQIF